MFKMRTLLFSRVPISVVVGLLLVLAMIPLSMRFERGMSTFDSAVWKNAQKIGAGKDSPRYSMTKGLLRQLEDRRPTKAEVIEMLGPSQDAEHPYALQYWLGAATFGFTPCQLRLYFAKNGRFEWARVVDDY
ncbi:MAG: hypothetical protein NT159_12370 [Proteobacteria bacterium]|nr:hypothetical protein [Pseudomonadota bacterium]